VAFGEFVDGVRAFIAGSKFLELIARLLGFLAEFVNPSGEIVGAFFKAFDVGFASNDGFFQFVEIQDGTSPGLALIVEFYQVLIGVLLNET